MYTTFSDRNNWSYHDILIPVIGKSKISKAFVFRTPQIVKIKKVVKNMFKIDLLPI